MTYTATRDQDALKRRAPGLTVLHVDDAAADQYRRRKALERGGFAVLDAATGTDGLAAVAAHLPDIALLDVKLPDTTGFELTRQIKAWASAADREIGVILISAYFTESEFRVRGLESGADAYLIEPLSDAELTASVGAVGRRVEELKVARCNAALLADRTQELKLADQAKNDFLASVVHELRQPISAALAALSIMKLRPDQARGQAAREVIERQIQQMSRITEDLLDATRIVRGQVTLDVKGRDLGPIVRRALDTVRAAAAERSIRLACNDPGEVIAAADESRLEQVLVNLLTNAVRYTPEGGAVDVTIERETATALVRVRDTGEGISADRLASIFDLFVRGHHSQGLGIGLAVAKALVDAHDGSLTAHSDGPGRGSEFVVRLRLDPNAPIS